MSVDWFLKLKEIDSLGKMRISYLKTIAQQNSRISKLLERREETNLESLTLSHKTRSLQQDLFDLEKKLQLFTQQRQNLMDLGGDQTKIKSFTNDIEKLENDGLELLGQQEEIQTRLDEIKTFQAGLDNTIKEIESEVSGDTKSQRNEIEKVDFRLKLLEEELPDNFQQVFRRTLLKNLAHGPFTRVDAGSCFFCRYKISRQDESEIDMQQILKTCNQCGRIFLPYGS